MSDEEDKDVAVPTESEAPKEPEAKVEEAAPAEAPAEDTPVAPAETETPAEAATEENPEATDTSEDTEDTSELEAKEIPRDQLNRNIRPGMLVRVHEIIKDVTPSGEDRRRVQVFEGTVLGLGGSSMGRTMTVRRVHKGFGVEKIYPLGAPTIEKIEVLKQYRTRRAKLNFLRGVFKRGKVKKRFRRKLKEQKDTNTK